MEKMTNAKRQTLALLVDNEPGVLSQIARLFSRKGYNIEAFAAGATENPGVTRITIDVLAEGGEQRNDVMQLANIFRAQIIDVSSTTLTLVVTGDDDKLTGMANILSEFKILEIARTGVVAIERGIATINDESKERGEFNYGKNVL